MKDLILQIDSKIIKTNFEEFSKSAKVFIASLRNEFKNEEDFAQAQVDIKQLKELETKTKDALDAVVSGSVETSNLINKTKEIIELFRENRLTREKLVKKEKEEIKRKIIDSSEETIEKNYDHNDEEIKRALLLKLPIDVCKQSIEQAARGKKTIDGINKAINVEIELSKSMIKKAINDIANRKKQIPKNKAYLFPDLVNVIASDVDIFETIKQREIAEQNTKMQEELNKQEKEQQQSFIKEQQQKNANETLGQQSEQKANQHKSNEEIAKYSIVIELLDSLSNAKKIATQLKREFGNVRLIKGE